MPEIMVLAPQLEIAQMIHDLHGANDDIGIVHARLDEAVAAAFKAVEEGTRVLVSRGLTYRLIADALPHIACVEIKVRGYDILRAFMQARSSEGRFAVVDRREVIDGFSSIEDILSFDTPAIKIILNDGRDFKEGVSQAIIRGATLIAGNQAIVQEAELRGLSGILVRSGRESIGVAMSIAFGLLARLRLQDANARQIDTIINAVDYGILAIDSQGEMTAINTEARRLLNYDNKGKARQTEFIGKMIKRVDSSERQTGLVEKFGANIEVVVNYHPITLNGVIYGMVATLQELKRLQDIEQKTRRELAWRGWVAKHRFSDIFSRSPNMLRLIEDAMRLAGYEATLLILGETGVGKEYFAHAIHNASRRKKGPFVAVNCASIPESILESELFGHAEGAFTGAKRGGKMGLFEQAHGGTIFLDEIGEMAENCQARLLRVLQEHEVYRLGDDRTITVDIRVIAATNRDLWNMVQEKKFREDLYYRLEVLTLEIPPLRERKVDIEGFVQQFINHYNRQYNASVTGINPEGQMLLLQYDWPGNIRELRNVVGRMVALSGTTEITVQDVTRCLGARFQTVMAKTGFRAAEIAVIRQTLDATGGNRQKAAKQLGIARSTLWRKLKEKES